MYHFKRDTWNNYGLYIRKAVTLYQFRQVRSTVILLILDQCILEVIVNIQCAMDGVADVSFLRNAKVNSNLCHAVCFKIPIIIDYLS